MNTQVDVQWTDAAEESFNKLKTLLLESSALLYNPKLTTVITIDTSDYGLGAVLTQLHSNNAERVVAFASRTLRGREEVFYSRK